MTALISPMGVCEECRGCLLTCTGHRKCECPVDSEAKRILRILSGRTGLTVQAATEVRNKYRDEVAVEMGRDLMEVGIGPFIKSLVGPDNANRLWARHAGEE